MLVVRALACPRVLGSVPFLFPVSVAQKAVVVDALEAVGQHVQQEAAAKLFGLDYHRLLLGIVALILVAECDLALRDVQEPMIGNGQPVGITADVVQDLFGAGKRPLGVDHPFGLAAGRQVIQK
jgi:hypothetical protein